MVDALRAAGEHEVGQLAAAVGEAAEVTSGRRGARARARPPPPSSPARTRVDRHPRLDAESARDREDRLARAADSASAGPRAARASTRPQRGSDQARARRPWRARSLRLTRARNDAIDDVGARRPRAGAGRRGGRRRRGGAGPRLELSLGQRQRLPLAAARRAGPPRAPAARPTAAVRSREPSSATTIAASGNCSRSASTVAPIRSSSSRAATRTVRRWRHCCAADGWDRREARRPSQVAEAVAPRLRPLRGAGRARACRSRCRSSRRWRAPP